MARELQRRRFYEGALFHLYHAYEALACAAIASRNIRIPRHHRQRFWEVRRLFRGASFYGDFFRVFRNLASMTGASHPMDTRNAALYFDGTIEPHRRFTVGDIAQAMQDVVSLFAIMRRSL